MTAPTRCPSAKRLLGGTPWRPRPPRVVVSIVRARRPWRAAVRVSRTLRGRPVVALTAPQSWVREPPPASEVAAMLCCARDAWLYDIASAVASSLATMGIAAAFAGPALHSGGVEVVEAVSSILGLAGFVYLVRSLAERGLEGCLEAHRPGAGVTGTTIYYQRLAGVVLLALRAAASCGSARCEGVEATPLGPYKVRVSTTPLYRVVAEPARGAG